MANHNPNTTPSKAAAELTSLAQLLHLTHYRNKNQHRLSKWYKSLPQFRRQVTKLLSEVEEMDTALSFSSSKMESKYVIAAREKVEARARFWEERLLERWFEAFSNLTADNQFAPLGLMLLGCLARARTVAGNLKGDSHEKAEIRRSNEEKVIAEERLDDVGEVVRRDETVNRAIEAPSVDEGVKVPKLKRQKMKGDSKKIQKEEGDSIPLQRPKKKRKKGDAFDDLFSSLM